MEKLALKCDEFFDGQLGVQRSCWADALAACAERVGFQLLCSAGQVTLPVAGVNSPDGIRPSVDLPLPLVPG